MANEITRVVSITVSKGGASISSGNISQTVDMAGADMAAVTQAIGTSNEALGVPADVTGDVHLVVKNLDADNYVEIFKDSGNSHLLSKLQPGQVCSLTGVPAASLYGRANTDTCQIQFWITEV